MRGILSDTIAEMLDRKTIWIYSGITLVGVLVVIAMRALEMNFQMEGMNPQGLEGMQDYPRLWFYNKFMYYLVLLSVLLSAGSFPNMLTRGRVDYYLSKPLSRRRHLATKTAALWIVYGTLITVSMLVVGGIGGLTLGTFDIGLIYIILTNLLALFIWLTVTTLASVWAGSAPVSILAVFMIWLLQQVLSLHELFAKLVDWPLIEKTVTVLYYIFPKTIQMSDSTLSLIMGASFDWMPLYSSIIFAFALFYIAIVLFNRKEF